MQTKTALKSTSVTSNVTVIAMFSAESPLTARNLRRRMARFNETGKRANRKVSLDAVKVVLGRKTPQTRANAFVKFVSITG
jgi:hypothetical protein